MGTSRHRTPAGVRLLLGPDRGAQITSLATAKKSEDPKKVSKGTRNFLVELKAARRKGGDAAAIPLIPKIGFTIFANGQGPKPTHEGQ